VTLSWTAVWATPRPQRAPPVPQPPAPPLLATALPARLQRPWRHCRCRGHCPSPPRCSFPAGGIGWSAAALGGSGCRGEGKAALLASTTWAAAVAASAPPPAPESGVISPPTGCHLLSNAAAAHQRVVTLRPESLRRTGGLPQRRVEREGGLPQGWGHAAAARQRGAAWTTGQGNGVGRYRRRLANWCLLLKEGSLCGRLQTHLGVVERDFHDNSPNRTAN